MRALALSGREVTARETIAREITTTSSSADYLIGFDVDVASAQSGAKMSLERSKHSIDLKQFKLFLVLSNLVTFSSILMRLWLLSHFVR